MLERYVWDQSFLPLSSHAHLIQFIKNKYLSSIINPWLFHWSGKGQCLSRSNMRTTQLSMWEIKPTTHCNNSNDTTLNASPTLPLKISDLEIQVPRISFSNSKGKRTSGTDILHFSPHRQRIYVFPILGKCTSIKETCQLQCRMNLVILSLMVVPEVVISLSLVLSDISTVDYPNIFIPSL